MRKPRGFTAWDVSPGVLYLRMEEDGRWVILAGDPEVKIDDAHDHQVPHLHVGGWNADDRRDLRPTLTAEEAAEAIRNHLEERGYIDVERLLEELR